MIQGTFTLNNLFFQVQRQLSRFWSGGSRRRARNSAHRRPSRRHRVPCKVSNSNYASPFSGEAYRDRQLTPNFELWVEIFCVPTCFHMRIPKPCLSVRTGTPRKEITPTLVIDTLMERSSRVPSRAVPILSVSAVSAFFVVSVSATFCRYSDTFIFITN